MNAPAPRNGPGEDREQRQQHQDEDAKKEHRALLVRRGIEGSVVAGLLWVIDRLFDLVHTLLALVRPGP